MCAPACVATQDQPPPHERMVQPPHCTHERERKSAGLSQTLLWCQRAVCPAFEVGAPVYVVQGDSQPPPQVRMVHPSHCMHKRERKSAGLSQTLL